MKTAGILCLLLLLGTSYGLCYLFNPFTPDTLKLTLPSLSLDLSIIANRAARHKKKKKKKKEK